MAVEKRSNIFEVQNFLSFMGVNAIYIGCGKLLIKNTLIRKPLYIMNIRIILLHRGNNLLKGKRSSYEV